MQKQTNLSTNKKGIRRPYEEIKKRCAVTCCRNFKDKHPNTVFYMFPSAKQNQARFDKWKSRTGITDVSDTDSYHVCGDHFVNADFYPATPTHPERLLRPSAVPSVNLPEVAESNIELRIEKFSSGTTKAGKILNYKVSIEEN